MQVNLSRKTNYKLQIMKQLFLAVFAASLIGCAEQAPPPAVTTGYTYSRYSTSAEVWGYRSPIYRNWTTAQLQQRRLELYWLVLSDANRQQESERKDFSRDWLCCRQTPCQPRRIRLIAIAARSSAIILDTPRKPCLPIQRVN